VFTGPKGGPLRRAHFNNLSNWVETVRRLGAPGLHFHDLRHTGNLLAAQTGASTKDLMAEWAGRPAPPDALRRRRGGSRDRTGERTTAGSGTCAGWRRGRQKASELRFRGWSG